MTLSRRSLLTGVAATLASTPLLISAAQATVESDDPFPIDPNQKLLVPPEFRRTVMPYEGNYPPGSIIVETGERHLYLVLPGGRAIRYGVAVGKDGFLWAGVADVGRKVMWPRWTPPKEMIARDEKYLQWANGMPGGPDNPLGARAMYLFKDGRDTMYRIHGTTAPKSIGTRASSGCLRMLNEDVVDLYRRVPIGTRVTVLGQSD